MMTFPFVFQTIMDVSEQLAAAPDLKPKSTGSPTTVLTDFDSGIETMDVDEASQSQTKIESNACVEDDDKRSEKRKRTSSSANYELTDDQVLGCLEDIFNVDIISGSSEKLKLTTTFALVEELKKEDSADHERQRLDYKEIVSSIIMEVLILISEGR